MHRSPGASAVVKHRPLIDRCGTSLRRMVKRLMQQDGFFVPVEHGDDSPRKGLVAHES